MVGEPPPCAGSKPQDGTGAVLPGVAYQHNGWGLADPGPGNAVELRLDAFNAPFKGRVVWINKSTGAQFALMPRNVVSGEFTKVVQRVPVRIALGKGQPLLERLLPGMSVVTQIHTDQAGPDGGK